METIGPVLFLTCSRPDFTNTEPTATIGPFPQWGDPKKIVAMDPWGHLAPWLFKDMIEKEDSALGHPNPVHLMLTGYS